MKRTLILLTTLLASSGSYADFPRPPILVPFCLKPDLVISQLPNPVYDHQYRVTRIEAKVANIGSSNAGTVIVKLVEDGQTSYSGLGQLLPGQTRSVFFYVPGNVFDPDANYRVTADPSNKISECRENNNSASFDVIG